MRVIGEDSGSTYNYHPNASIIQLVFECFKREAIHVASVEGSFLEKWVSLQPAEREREIMFCTTKQLKEWADGEDLLLVSLHRVFNREMIHITDISRSTNHRHA